MISYLSHSTTNNRLFLVSTGEQRALTRSYEMTPLASINGGISELDIGVANVPERDSSDGSFNYYSNIATLGVNPDTETHRLINTAGENVYG